MLRPYDSPDKNSCHAVCCDVLNLLSQVGVLLALGSWLREPITLLPEPDSP